MLSPAFVTLLSFVAAATGSLVLHDTRPSPPAGFVHQGAAPASQALTLRVGLTSTNTAGLEAKLLSISDPASNEYAQWLTADQVRSYVAPTSATLATFHSFAKANGLTVSSLSDTNEWVEFTTNVSHANTLFGASYQDYKHSSTGTTLTRTLAYSLPEELVGHVDTLTPATDFAIDSRFVTKFKPLKNAATPAKCNTLVSTGSITPKCLQDIYGIPTAATKSNTTLLVTAYEDEYANRKDLAAFFKHERPDVTKPRTFHFASLDKGKDSQSADEAGSEANLDIEYTMGIATGVNTTFLSVGGYDFVKALVDTTTYLGSLAQPPLVMTTSYGDDEANFALKDAKKICNGFMALGARGVSVIFASGDGGVRGNHDDPSQCKNKTFIPVFPASCPYVTAVGSTIGLPEIAINFTGGGFSNYFAQPSWQSKIVPGYLKTLPSSFAGKFNHSGRGYPDVAVQGWDFEVIIGGELGLIGGTSASSPTFASVIALINDRLAQAGKKSLGFLNPFLYQSAGPAGAFNDITKGKNVGFTCNDTAVAFSAGAGWDPVTGFGTPNFPKLLTAAGIKN